LYAGDVIIPGDAYDGLEKVEQGKKITDLLRPGQGVVVQVSKDPVGTKGARVTTHIALAGRSLVLMPTVDYVGVSKRIDKEDERARVRKILHDIKPKNMGVIVRTASAGRTRESFEEDLESLLALYGDIEAKSKKGKPPKLLHAEQSLLFRTVRDLLMKDVDRVFVNDAAAYEKLREIAEVMAPKLRARVLYKDSASLFERYETESQIEAALARKVWLPSGGYLIFDRSEAMTIIDVNTGKFVGKDNLEKTITATNIEGAKEIAKQLRLRDIGGIIIVDFIDMDKESNRQQVLHAMREAMRADHTHARVFGFTHLGLMEITRKKTGRSIGDTLKTTCPYCEGNATILSPQTVFGKLRKQTLQVLKGSQIKRMYIEAHPEVVAVMERLFKAHGALFPENSECLAFIKANETLHREKYIVKPLSTRKVAECKKTCKIMH
ncbi:MAG: Rne/Rng family ribonuclease, partial [Clostridiales bacterium]|nr:Rne/Rng family ribonuclease [Clostridiales bacterium]